MSLYSLETLGQLEGFVDREWLLTNHLGAFAASSVLGCNTRRYHGLLCAAIHPPVGRVMLLNRLAETMVLAGSNQRHELAVNQFDNVFHPQGQRYLQRFELDQTACWIYEVEGVKIRKELQILWMRNAVMLRYELSNVSRPMSLHVRPFVGFRDFHSLRHGREGQFDVKNTEHGVCIAQGQNNLWLRSAGCDQADGQWETSADWWMNHTYRRESERGLDDREDLFTPGCFNFNIQSDCVIELWASAEPLARPDWQGELDKRAAARPASEDLSTPRRKLQRAAEDFVVSRAQPDAKPGTTILAGYPWFADWGRDTMISLPGILLSRGKVREAGQVLGVFGRHISQGMIPNRFDDYTNQPHYNTVDASLWFIHAAFCFRDSGGDAELFTQELLPACQAIVEGYRKGTRFDIHMDDTDAMIIQGDAHTQLTWMDAKHGDTAFTPRQGKAVEINALWYHALCLLEQTHLAQRARAGFIKNFWISPWRGLADVVNGSTRDAAIRPNQIFAVSLANSPLDEDQRRAVVELVRRELLTPYGLRTLGKNEPGYHSHFRGTMAQRDQAYHNGTVWPWLLGPFIEAYLRVNMYAQHAVVQSRAWLAPLMAHLENDGCIGQIAEVFDAEEPYLPGGCFAQAWSVAEVLRMAAEVKL